MTVSRFGGLWGACFGNLTLWWRTKHYCQCAFPGWCSIANERLYFPDKYESHKTQLVCKC